MRKIIKFIYIILLIVILCGCKIGKNPNDDGYNDDLKVYFINVGQADCTFIMLPNNENILIQEYDEDYFFKNFDETIFKKILSD